MILLAVLLIGTVLCVCAFCHALCNMLRISQNGSEMKTQVVRLQISLCGALVLPAAAVIWAVYSMMVSL